MRGSILGTEVRRVEDRALLVGQGRFIDNLPDQGVLHAVFVRSPFAHARLTAIDVETARRSPGVVAIFTSAELGTSPVPQFGTAAREITRTALADEQVRFVGDPVALIVATTRAAAADAVELVDIDYEPLPAVVSIEEALAEGAVTSYAALPSNVAAVRTVGNGEALSDAARVVGLRMENRRLSTAPMECHAIEVHPHSEGPYDLTVHVGTQQPHGSAGLVAKLLGVGPDRVRVIAPDVGGGFGGKAGVIPDHCAVILAARRLGRPVRWIESRSENLTGMQGRGQVQYARLGVDDQAKITGLEALVLGDCGAYAGFNGGFALGTTFMMVQGCYDLPKLDYTGVAVMTNTAPVGAFRGAGRPEAAALLERLVDHAAREVGLTPEEFRRRNFLAPEAFPVTTRTGVTYDNGNYDLALTRALELAEVDSWRDEQRRRRESGVAQQIGVGISAYVEITGFGGTEYGHVDVQSDGTVTVKAGTSAHGQGHATAFSMLAADVLQVPIEQVRFVQSDTAEVPTGGGTGGSRSLQMGGNAVSQAAHELRDRAIVLAAHLLEADVNDVALDQAGFGVIGVPGRAITWADLAAHAISNGAGLSVDADFHQTGATFPFGAHVSVVEVDTETGSVRPLRHIAVDDCGRVLNPLLVAGQQHGGLAQGISQALWEEFEYDDEGTPLTSTFADYVLPSAADLVSFEVSNTETPTPLNPLGAKGIGESATVGATPAVQNAVIDALAHLGVRHVDIPCTPRRVYQALTEAAAGTHRVWSAPPAIPDQSSSTAVAETVEI